MNCFRYLPKHPTEGQYEHDSNTESSFCYDRQSLKYSKSIQKCIILKNENRSMLGKNEPCMNCKSPSVWP